MEPVKESISFAFYFEVYEANVDSFSVGGNRYYVHDHGLEVGDMVKITIKKRSADVHANRDNKDR
jgi:hypothetical protein